MSTFQHCSRYRVRKEEAAFDRGRSGILQKTCRKCLDQKKARRTAQSPIVGEPVAPTPSLQMVNDDGLENVDWRWCVACQQAKDMVDFDTNAAGQPRLSCRKCLEGITLPESETQLHTGFPPYIRPLNEAIDYRIHHALPNQTPVHSSEQVVMVQGPGRQGPQQRCGDCGQDKPGVEFNLNTYSILQKCCRSCLARRHPTRQSARGHRVRPLPDVSVVVEPSSPLYPAVEEEPCIILEELAGQLGLHVALPFAALEHRDRWTVSDLGHMQVVCSACNALHWMKEKTRGRDRRIAGAFESCCKRGDVKVNRLQELPEPLNTLMTGQDGRSRLFRQNLRQWNSVFAFTSTKFNMDDRPTAIGEGFQLFQIHGAVYHQQGPLLPAAARDALYSQIYLYDPAFAAQVRSTRAPELDRDIMISLTQMLQETSPYIQLYLTARERFAQLSENEPNLRIILDPQLKLVVESGADMRRENLPTADEVALILPEEYGQRGLRDLVLA
ncbi:hypothetical protein HOY80DRAFT_1028878 [Tuber brumale]|nr:hypothetical protein HOY80DRAFT_1028878 [Tuber brumale]